MTNSPLPRRFASEDRENIDADTHFTAIYTFLTFLVSASRSRASGRERESRSSSQAATAKPIFTGGVVAVVHAGIADPHLDKVDTDRHPRETECTFL
jgi:hypothetical protein